MFQPDTNAEQLDSGEAPAAKGKKKIKVKPPTVRRKSVLRENLGEDVNDTKIEDYNLLSVDGLQALAEYFQEGKKEFLTKKRRASIFNKQSNSVVDRDAAKTFLDRFIHLASGAYSHASKPDGIGVVFAITCEVRALVLDTYESRKDAGDNSVSIFNKMPYLVRGVQKLENLLEKMMMSAAEKSGTQQVTIKHLEDKKIPSLLLTPLLCISERVVPAKPGLDHAKLYALAPELKTMRIEVVTNYQRNYDPLTCLFMIVECLGKLAMQLCLNTELRKKYYSAVMAVFTSSRMAAWSELIRRYDVDLRKSDEFKGTNILDAEANMEAVTARRTRSKSISQMSRGGIPGFGGVPLDNKPLSGGPSAAPPPGFASASPPPPPSPGVHRLDSADMNELDAMFGGVQVASPPPSASLASPPPANPAFVPPPPPRDGSFGTPSRPMPPAAAAPAVAPAPPAADAPPPELTCNLEFQGRTGVAALRRMSAHSRPDFLKHMDPDDRGSIHID